MTEPLVATIRIAAAPAVVFPYFVDPALMARWIGDAAASAPEPGGAFAVAITDAKSIQGTFLTIDPPERVVFTWGVPGSDVLPPGSTTVEVVLTADGADTLVQLTHHDLPPAEVPSHRAGWTGLFRVLAGAAGR